MLHHLEEYRQAQETLVNRLIESTYVDDVILGAEDSTEAFSLYLDCKHIFREGGFNLRKFITNDIQLQTRINSSEELVNPSISSVIDNETYAKAMIREHQYQVSPGDAKVLGVLWKVEEDHIVFDLSDIVRAAKGLSHPSKRQITSVIGKIPLEC